MNKPFRTIMFIVFAALTLTACNLPTVENGAATNDAKAVFTAAAQTVEAQMTLTSLLTPPATATATETSIPPTNTPLPHTPTITATCDQAQFIKDVTIPDGTVFAPNTTYEKTWRFRNIGACTWSGYSLVFERGDAMGGSASVPIGMVAPGQSVDITVNLTSPASPGTYRGFWRIRNASGVLLPMSNGFQGRSVFVEIVVPSPTAPVASLTLNPTGGTESGTVYQSGSGSVVSYDTIQAGDTANNFISRGYMSFNISSLAGKTIHAAVLDLSGCTQLNNPFSDLAGIWVGEVQYTLPLDQTDYDVTGTGIQKLVSFPNGTIDVKSFLQARATASANRFQIRLHPAASSDADNLADHLSCGTSAPALIVTYQP